MNFISKTLSNISRMFQNTHADTDQFTAVEMKAALMIAREKLQKSHAHSKMNYFSSIISNTPFFTRDAFCDNIKSLARHASHNLNRENTNIFEQALLEYALKGFHSSSKETIEKRAIDFDLHYPNADPERKLDR